MKDFIMAKTKTGLVSFKRIFYPRMEPLKILPLQRPSRRLENWKLGNFCGAIKYLIRVE